MLVRGLLVTVLALLILAGTFTVLGLAIADYLWVYGFASEERSPLIVRLYAAAMAGGPPLLLAPFALLHRPQREAWFFLLWFGLTTSATWILLADLETRYFLPNLVPLLGLAAAAIGGIVAHQRPAIGIRGSAVACLLAVALAALGRMAQPFLEHEVKSEQIAQTLEALDLRYGGSGSYTLLTAWHHTDYHFLRVTYPNHRIRSVERTVDRRSVSELNARDRRFYGDEIVLRFEELATVPRPWLYFGFEANHAIANFRWLADRLPNEGLSIWARGIIDRMAKRAHFHTTWVCRDPRLVLVPVLDHGHYRVAELVPTAPIDVLAGTVETIGRGSTRLDPGVGSQIDCGSISIK